MLMIRLARIGKKKQPHYRLVVSEKARDLYGRALEIVGHYNPRSKEAVLQEERITYWMGRGAQASATVHNLLVTKGVLKDEKKRSVSNLNNKKRSEIAKKEEEAKTKVKAAEEAAKAEAERAAAPAEEPAAEAPAAEEATA